MATSSNQKMDTVYEDVMSTISTLLGRVDNLEAKTEQTGTSTVKEFEPPEDWGTNFTSMKIDTKDLDYIVCTYRNNTDMHKSVIMHSTMYGKFWTGSNKNQTDGAKGYSMCWQHTKYDKQVWEKVD
jgi:hypothetical protein